jgi:hypothetical protein
MSHLDTTSAPANFAARVLERTGRNLEDIFPAGPGALCAAHIVAKDEETNTYVVFVGYPEGEDEETGQEFWPASALRKITVPDAPEAGWVCNNEDYVVAPGEEFETVEQFRAFCEFTNNRTPALTERRGEWVNAWGDVVLSPVRR